MNTPNPSPPIALIVSRYNRSVTGRLLNAAIDVARDRGFPENRVATIEAPGAFELTALANASARTGNYAGIAVLGCLIHGETRHDRYIAEAVAQGITQITIKTGVPVAFGLVTAETPAQAEARSGGHKGNKGAEAAEALIDTIEAMASINRALARGEPGRIRHVIGRTPADKAFQDPGEPVSGDQAE